MLFTYSLSQICLFIFSFLPHGFHRQQISKLLYKPVPHRMSSKRIHYGTSSEMFWLIPYSVVIGRHFGGQEGAIAPSVLARTKIFCLKTMATNKTMLFNRNDSLSPQIFGKASTTGYGIFSNHEHETK